MSNELAIPEQENNGATLALLRPVASPEQLLQAHKEAVQLIEKVLEQDKDYGVIPGTGDKPTLLKPGAERLLTAFGCYADSLVLESESLHNHENTFQLKKWTTRTPKPPQAEADRLKSEGVGRWKKDAKGNWEFQDAEVEEGHSLGLYRFVVKCNIVHRESGRIIASGVGSCSSMESKYIRAPRDYENTVLKMAKKRAMVDAVLNAFGLSDRFTQDVEEFVDHSQEVPKASKSTTPTPEEPILPAGKFLKEIGFTPEQLTELKQDCLAKGLDWKTVALESKAAGPQDVFDYLESVTGKRVVDEETGEVVEVTA